MSKGSPENLKPVLLISHDDAMVRKFKPEFRAHKMQLFGASHIDEIEKILEKDNPRYIFIDDQVKGFTPEDFPNKYLVSITQDDPYEKGPEKIESGYETYLLKPVKPSHARHVVQRLERWSTPKIEQQETIEIGDLFVDPSKREISINGNPLYLTKVEYELLVYLSSKGFKTSPQKSLIAHIDSLGYVGNRETLKVHLSNIRGKLRSVESKTIVTPIHDLGYKLYFYGDE